MKLFKTIITALAVPTLLIQAVNAQTNNPQQVIDSKSFVFTAQTVSPAYGQLRQLTSADYTLSVSPDAVVAYLPYFGRAYSAPIDPTQGGLKFTSKQFEYNSKAKRKEWDITIKPHDAGDATEMFLTIFDNGTANLQVISSSRQPISFNGIIEPKK